MRYAGLTLLLLFSTSVVALAAEDAPIASLPIDNQNPVSRVQWHNDYHAGLDAAESNRRLAFIWFFDPASAAQNEEFENEVLNQLAIRLLFDVHHVAIKLPITATVLSGGKSTVLLDHPAFAEMLHRPGLAIIDMTDRAGPHHRHVISVWPFTRGPISADKLALLLDLPLGTLTQRTLIYAVRTHPELPASTAGHLSPVLTRETENHAWHQASITLQGHHNWNARFHAINAKLPGGLAAREVCAESWPGQNLVEAAVECVHSWRQSSGHWEAVSSRHTLFAYDMKRGRNGVWYAAGIFAGRN
jgi:hypothetical protein